MWKDYFSFNKRQRNGIFVLLFLIVTLVVWLNISNHLSPAVGYVDTNALKSLANSPRHDSLLTSSIAPDSNVIHKLSINKVSIKELSKQPNIGHYLAQAIVNYRKQHGPYKTLNDLLKNAAIDSATFNKIAPYLTTN